MVGRELDLFTQQAKADSAGRDCLAVLRVISKLFALFGPMGRKRDANGFLAGRFRPKTDGDMYGGLCEVSGCSDTGSGNGALLLLDGDRERAGCPNPLLPYIVPGSRDDALWLPTDDPRMRALERWKAMRQTYHRYVGNKDLATGQLSLYRRRFIPVGDLKDAWADFGCIGAQINHLTTAVSLSIKERAGIALAYDYRTQRAIRKLPKMRSTRTDYAAILGSAP